MKLFLLTLFITVLSLSLFAQCEHAQELVDSGDVALKRKDYTRAINKYSAAMLCSEKAVFVQQKLKKVFFAIENEKNNALFEKRKAQSLALATVALDYYDKDPTKAICLAEIAWEKSPIYPPNFIIERALLKLFYNSTQNKLVYYSKNFEYKGFEVLNTNLDKIISYTWEYEPSKDISLVKLWDIENNKVFKSFKGHKYSVNSLVFSPKGDIVVTTSYDSTANMWNLDNCELLRRFDKHEASVSWAVFSEDGSKLATNSLDNNVRVWDALNGKELCNIISSSIHRNPYAFSSDGSKIVTISNGSTLKIWDVNNCKKVLELDVGNLITSTMFSTDGSRIVLSFRYGAIILDTYSGESLIGTVESFKFVKKAMFYPDEKKFLTITSENVVRVWDANTGNYLYDLKRHAAPINNILFSSGGDMILTSSEDKTAKVWDANTGEILKNIFGHTDKLINAIFTEDDSKVSTSSMDGMVKVWNLRNYDQLRLNTKFGYFDLIILSPDKSKIITSSGDSIRLWDLEKEKLVGSFGVNNYVTDISCSIDNTKIVTALSDSTINVLDIRNETLLTDLNELKDSFYEIKLSSDGHKLVTISGGNSVKIWDIKNNKLLQMLKHNNAINSAVFSSDGSRIITASDDSTAKVWNTKNGKHLLTLKHKGAINSAAFSSDGGKIITTSDDSTAKAWDARKGRLLHNFKGHSGIVYFEVFSNYDDKFITSSSDNTMKLWDVNNGKLLCSFIGHGDIILSTTFSPDNLLVLTTSIDNTSKLWDTRTGHLLFSINGNHSLATFSKEGDYFITVDDNSIVKTWLTPSGIIKWLRASSIYDLNNEDFKELGLDFMIRKSK